MGSVPTSLTGSARLARALATLSASAGLAALAAGCGGAGAAAPATARAAVAPLPARHVAAKAGPLTRARALAYARAVNLTAADVPEGRVNGHREKNVDPIEHRELVECGAEAVKATPLAQAQSPRIVRGTELETEELRSSVTVRASPRAAVAELAPLSSSRVRACVARVLTRRSANKSVRNARWGRFTVSALKVPTTGSIRSLGVRVAATLELTFSEVAVPIYVDIVGFARGPAVVTMSAISPTQPVPAPTEQRLLALLLARAQARPL